MKLLRVIENNSRSDQPAERSEVLDALTALIECFPNAPKKSLAAYAEKLLERVSAKQPTAATMTLAIDRLIEANGYLPTIKAVLDAIDDAASSLGAVQVKPVTVDLNHLGHAGKLLLARYGADVAVSWFKKLEVIEDHGADLVLAVSTEFIRDRLLSDYAEEIADVAGFQASPTRDPFRRRWTAPAKLYAGRSAMSEQRLLLAHQIAERTLNARVQVLTFHDPDGAKRFAVAYSNAVHQWLSGYRFETDVQADAAAMVLREWLLGGHQHGRR